MKAKRRTGRFAKSTELVHGSFIEARHAAVMDALLSEGLDGIFRRFEESQDFFCSDCRYGVVARWSLPERCPMCGALSWASAGSLHYGGAMAEIDSTPTRGGAVRLTLAETWQTGAIETLRAA